MGSTDSDSRRRYSRAEVITRLAHGMGVAVGDATAAVDAADANGMARLPEHDLMIVRPEPGQFTIQRD